MDNKNINKKRERTSSEGSELSENQDNLTKKLKLPKKSDFRMHAHCNPLAEMSIPYPITPSSVDWSLHYPNFYSKTQKVEDKIYANTAKYQINYNLESYPESSNNNPNNTKDVTIVDVGCGYGGLLFNMSNFIGEKYLALGMEIRDKVTNFVAERINTYRINSGFKDNNNISVIRTNSMKCLLNYFYKDQLEKVFFCFPDPHFKKYNYRKRIINKYLLNDYVYLLSPGGKLYTITDVEDLYKWHLEVISANPTLKPVDKELIETDDFIAFMKNTDEARKVKKKNGEMFITVHEKVSNNIDSIDDLWNLLK